ncbi:MAG: gamma-glutamyltransferase, partial [Betaproteobacteria bacterium]|nr:gamma-glutamyltransferase [Betaproteobacteria bacterium]
MVTIWGRTWHHLIAAGLLSTCIVATAQTSQDSPEKPSGYTPKKAVTARHSMVVAAHPLAVAAGVKMLDKGGSAVDAAIAVQLVLNLVEPQSSGIGGGAFMLHLDGRTQALDAYDGRETAPAGVTPDLFLKADGKPMGFYEAVIGGRSVGVPGVLRMLEMAHARHGKLPWTTLFQPAIDLARSGFAMSGRTRSNLDNNRALLANPATRAYFYLPDGSPKPAGSILKNPAFAAVLQRIALAGPDAFYTGPIAADIAAAVQNYPGNPGALSVADLAAYRARRVEPLCGPYRLYRLCGMPPPSSGGISVLQIMQMLERFDLAAISPQSAEAVHLFAEAGKLAYADRDFYVADDRFADVPLAGLAAPDYNHARSLLIDPNQAASRAQRGSPAYSPIVMGEDATVEIAGTSHFSIVDRAGNAVSMTTTVESFFGSHVFVHGFFLNNQLTDFSPFPTNQGRPVANAIFPGKRPRSSMAPTLVFDAHDKLYMVIGSPGGPAIINYVAKTLVATLDWGLDMQAAVSLPNFGSRNGPTEVEKGTSLEALLQPLRALGHDARAVDFN